MLLRILRWLILIVLVTSALWSQRSECLGVLSKTVKPQDLQVAGDKLLVMQGTEIHVYRRRGLTFLFKFGQSGEGPGEIPETPFWTNSFHVVGDQVFIEAFTKVLWYDLEGHYLKELRKTRQTFKTLPAGDAFVARSFPLVDEEKNEHYTALLLYDPQFHVVRELQRRPEAMLNKEGLFTMVPDPIQFDVSGDRIYVKNNAGGLHIDIFDFQGRKRGVVTHPVKKQAVDAAARQEALARLKENFQRKTGVMIFVPVHIGEGGWKVFRQWADLRFPKYFPAVKDFWVTRRHIFVQTHKREKDRDQFFVFTKAGQFVKELHLPSLNNPLLMGYSMAGIGARMSVFSDDAYFWLMEDEDNDHWQVYQVKLRL